MAPVAIRQLLLRPGSISPDGRFIAWSAARSGGRGRLPEGSYLVDRTTGVPTPLDLGSGSVLALSRNGRAALWVVSDGAFPGGDPSRSRLYLRDLAAHRDAGASTSR